jgi:hypothetical protein
MPIESIIAVSVIVAVFLIFSLALAWAEFTTRRLPKP